LAGDNDLSVVGVEHHHVGGIATGCEQNGVLRVERKARAGSAFAFEVVMGGDRERFHVHDRDVGLVLDVDIEMPLVVRHRLFRHTSKIDCAGDRGVSRVDDRRSHSPVPPLIHLHCEPETDLSPSKTMNGA
jgi:hypothetical protein